MKELLIACLLVTAATQISSAQNSRKVQFRTLCIERAKDVDKVVIPGPGKTAKSQDVALYTDISPVIDGVFGNGEAIFYGEKTGADGKLERVPVGKAKLGKSARQLFVFAPNVDAKSESPYRVLAFDDDEKSFPMATVRAINLASVPVRYDFSGGVQVEIAPGQSLQLPQAKEVNEYNLYHVTVNYKNAAGEWVESSTTNWKSSEKKREIAVTEFSNDSQTLTVRLYGDLPPWRK